MEERQMCSQVLLTFSYVTFTLFRKSKKAFHIRWASCYVTKTVQLEVTQTADQAWSFKWNSLGAIVGDGFKDKPKTIFFFSHSQAFNNHVNRCLDYPVNTVNSETTVKVPQMIYFPAESWCSNSLKSHWIITVPCIQDSFSQWICSLETIIEGLGCSSTIKHLSSMCKVLGLITSSQK